MSRNVGKKRGAQPRPSTGSTSSGGKKALLPFVGGLLLGLLIAGGIYLLQILPTAMDLREKELLCADPNGKSAAENAAIATEQPADKKPVTFDFYNMLTRQQTVAPAPGRSTTQAAPVPPPIPPVAVAPGTPGPVPAPPPPAIPPSLPAATPAAQAPAVAAPAAVPTPAPAPPPAVAPAAKTTNHYALQAGSFATRAEADRRRGELVLSGLDVNVQQAITGTGESRFRVMVGPFADDTAMKKAQKQLAGMKIDTLPVRLK